MNQTIQKIIKDYRERFVIPDIGVFKGNIMQDDIERFLLSSLSTLEREVREEEQYVDHSIDVRYEPDVIKAFDKFIKKWCGIHYAHLIDDDEQDGQFMREKIEALLEDKK